MGKELTAETLQDGKVFEDRRCSDILMIIFAFLFAIGWVIVAYFAIANGRPSRLLMPENFRGDLCGDPGGPNENVTKMFVPKPSRLQYGLCVPRCPAVGDYVCNNDYEPMIENPNVTVRNDYYNHNGDEYITGRNAFWTCYVLSLSSCNSTLRAMADRYTSLLKKYNEYKCFYAFYTTGSTLFRCLPFQTEKDNTTLYDLAGESKETVQLVASKLGVSAFFSRGFGETQQSWAVIAICGLSAMVLSILWIILLRCCMAPIIYFCILLIFVLLILIGYVAMLMADDLEKVVLPGDTSTQDQVYIWRAIQWGFWILAAVYFLVMVWMFRRIRIAIVIMKEGSKAFTNNCGLVIIPPIVFIVVIGWVVLALYLAFYIHTIGKTTTTSFREAAVNAFGETAVNGTLSAVNATSNLAVTLNLTNSSNTTVNTTEWTQEDLVKGLHAYNFFGFLWAANFSICWGFWIMSMATVAWYFSATTIDLDRYDNGAEGGRQKGSPVGTLCKSFCYSWKAIGTILWGSFLIAVIQFIRAVMLYLEEEFLSEWKESCGIKCLLYCINCCLAYIERVIKIISKNAFIINCISSENFCTCAGEAVSLLVENAARVGVLALMSTVACFVLKLFIVFSNCFLAWYLLKLTALTGGVEIESGLFPIVFVFFLTFIVASLFVSVYESCTDAVMMSFLWDEKHLQGAFMTPELAKLCDQFAKAENARKEYNKRVNDACDGNDSAEPTKVVEAGPEQSAPSE